jgi:hypothetical protein
MKTVKYILILVAGILFGGNVPAAGLPSGMLSVHVAVSAKAYWDGATKSCIPREKGGCCHIWVEAMEPGPGEICGDMALIRGNIFQLSFSRGKGLNNDTWQRYFADGKFLADGPITFDPAVLMQLGLPGGYVIPSGSYPVAVNGDQIVITFK